MNRDILDQFRADCTDIAGAFDGAINHLRDSGEDIPAHNFRQFALFVTSEMARVVNSGADLVEATESMLAEAASIVAEAADNE